jgi:hypothetical protein
MMETFAVVLVESTSQAMRVEHVLNTAGSPCKLIPVPRVLSSNCGNCVRIAPEDIKNAREVLARNKIHELDVQVVTL